MSLSHQATDVSFRHEIPNGVGEAIAEVDAPVEDAESKGANRLQEKAGTVKEGKLKDSSLSYDIIRI